MKNNLYLKEKSKTSLLFGLFSLIDWYNIFKPLNKLDRGVGCYLS